MIRVMPSRTPKNEIVTEENIASAMVIGDWAQVFPPILNGEQVQKLLGITKGTFYAWTCAGRFDSCGRKVGKHWRFFRDKLILEFFNNGLDEQE